MLQEFYLTLREKHRGADRTPVTTRQLESLIRLSEARARLELREEVTSQDAQDVIDIMRDTLFDSFEDKYGNIDMRRSGMSKNKEINRFVTKLQQVADKTLNPVFTYQQLFNLKQEIGLNVANFDDFIDTLNNQGYLLKKGARNYKLMTTSCSLGSQMK